MSARLVARPGFLARLESWARGRASSTGGGESLIAASGLFDLSFYLIEGPDVHEAGIDPIAHFCAHGWREGRRPNLYFDPLWYCGRYLARSPGNPLVHYIAGGEAAGCRPVCYFDPVWYRGAYRIQKRVSALGHYLKHRRSQRYAPNAHFDLAFYLARHGGEIGPNRDPFAHLLRLGTDQDLDPSAAFDSAAYRKRAMTLEAPRAAGLAAREHGVPLIHYLDALTRAPEELAQPRC